MTSKRRELKLGRQHVAIGTLDLIERPIRSKRPDNNTLHTEPWAARLLETMIFAAAR